MLQSRFFCRGLTATLATILIAIVCVVPIFPEPGKAEVVPNDAGTPSPMVAPQLQPANPPQNLAHADLNRQELWWYNFAEWLWKLLGSHVIAILTSVLSIIFATLTSRLKHRLNALFLPPPIKIDETRNSILVVGIGGTGKTSVIKALTGASAANPKISTNEFRIYRYVQEIADEKDDIRRSNMYFADYIGQDLSSLISGFIDEQKTPYSPLRHGYLNSLILVVDLVAPPPFPDHSIPKTDNFDAARVKQNINEWNTQSLQAVFGLYTSEQLRYICLFINKFDLINLHDRSTSEAILHAYEPLRAELNKFSRGAIYECVIGSAKTGQSIGQLKESLAAVRGAQVPIKRSWFGK